MHNGTGDYALIPSLYKTKPFTMHRPLAVAVDPLCGQSLDAEVYCIFANRSQFRADGRALTLDAGATLIRDSCHRKVVDACKATWAATGVTPTLQTCPKVLADYPPQSAEVNSETSKFLCDHEFSKCSTEVPVLKVVESCYSLLVVKKSLMELRRLSSVMRIVQNCFSFACSF